MTVLGTVFVTVCHTLDKLLIYIENKMTLPYGISKSSAHEYNVMQVTLCYRSAMSKREIIEFIEANPNASSEYVAKTLCVSRRSVQMYRCEVLGAFRVKRHTDALRLKYALMEIERCGDIVEWLSGEMEFNVCRQNLVRECARYFNVRYDTVEHAIDCCVDAKERKRWRDALRRKSRNNRFVK